LFFKNSVLTELGDQVTENFLVAYSRAFWQRAADRQTGVIASLHHVKQQVKVNYLS
jgi:hypothetical protein